MSGITSKLLLLNKMTILVKATSDDSSPTPGYLYEEITHLTFGSAGQTTALLDFLVNRLDIRSCYVKLKVLNIMIRLVQKGHPDFAAGLRRSATGINKATMHSGPPHALCDNAPYVAVRKAASELSAILFDTEKEVRSSSMDMTGYGVSKSKTTMEGFGNTQATQEKTFTDQLKNGIQQITGSFSAKDSSNHTDSSGRAYTAMSETNKSYPKSSNSYKGGLVERTSDVRTAAGGKQDVRESKKDIGKNVENPDVARISYKGGKAGGGWEEDGSSDGVSSGHSNGSTPLSEKLQSAVVEDWNQEAKCVEDIVRTNEGRLIPSRQELDQLEKRCDTLNCDQVLEFLIQKVVSGDNVIQMRALCAIERLLNTDLLGHDTDVLDGSLQEVIAAAQVNSKQAVSKAKKILRQIQSAAKQEEIRSLPTTQQSKETLPTDRLVASNSNDSNLNLLDNTTLNNDSKNNYGQDKKLNDSKQTNALNISSKSDNIVTSFFDGLTMDMKDRSKNGEMERQMDRNILPLGGQTVNLYTDKNKSGSNTKQIELQTHSSSSTIDSVKTSKVNDVDVRDSVSDSKRTDGSRQPDKSRESSKDPLLSGESSIGDLLTSLHFKTDDLKITSGKTRGRTSMNQIPTTHAPQKQQQSLDKDTIAAMFPQLSTSTLSGTSAVPLQLGKKSGGSFGFIASQTDDKAKPKMHEKFDFVQEAMKSAITK